MGYQLRSEYLTHQAIVTQTTSHHLRPSRSSPIELVYPDILETGGPQTARKTYKPEGIVAKLRQVDGLHSQGITMAETVRQIGVTD